ncbi:MAG: histidine kinase [Chitinivibrionales bacterium]|nr:histidine kinase [Chitinivibrionales bacterium]
MKPLPRPCLWLPLLASALISTASDLQNRLEIDPSLASLSLDSYVYFMIDTSTYQSPQEIAPGSDTLFRHKSWPYFKWTQAAIWLRFVLHNPSGDALQRWIVMDCQFIDSLDTYIIETDSEPSSMRLIDRTGRHFPISQRKLKFINLCVPVTIAPGAELVVYQRIRSSEANTVLVNLWEPLSYFYDQRSFFFNGIYYGFVIIILIVSMAFFILLREKTYLYYALMLLFVDILFTMGRQGYSQLFLFPSAPKFALLTHLSYIAIGQVFWLLLVRSFFRYTFRSSWQRWIYYGLISMNCILALCPFAIGYRITSQLIHVTSMFTIVAIVYMNIMVIRNNLPALYFFVAWIFHVFGAITLYLHSYGALHQSFFIHHGYQIGITMELLLISCAMAYAVFRERQKRNSAQQSAMQSLKRLMLSRIQELQAKVNPHFLFNILNSIAQLIKEDPKQAHDSVMMLSGFYQTLLKFSRRKTVRLSEEMDLVNLYITLQKLRFGEKIGFSQTIDSKISDFEIPGLILQPLVENSIKHGIHPKVNGGHIWICGCQKENKVSITVRDNGVGWSDKYASSGHGIENVQDRLKFFFNSSYEMKITNDNGVTIELLLPMEKCNAV